MTIAKLGRLSVLLALALLLSMVTLLSSMSVSRPIRTVDWFHEDVWHTNNFTKECWHVENICHSSHRWFYDPRSLNPIRQPPFSIGLYEIDDIADRLLHRYPAASTTNSSTFLGRPKKIFVEAPQANPVYYESPDGADFTSSSFLQTCKYSPIVNHMVLQSYYNDMLGEFYVRSVVQLYAIYNAATTDADAHKTNPTRRRQQTGDHEIDPSFTGQTQMYLHVRNLPEYSTLLDSHHLFTDAFRSNAMLSFTYLLDYTGCRCLKRLLLCGYDAKIGDEVQHVRGHFPKSTRPLELIPAGTSGPAAIERGRYQHLISELRSQLLENVVNRNPFLKKDIASFRAEAIKRYLPALTPQQASEYRVIGLTQRKGRRRWLDLDNLIRRCNTEWFGDSDKVVCVEINLESEDVNPVRQVVIHAACDMLVGIHGAQLTEAVWMKDGSVVAELLPWLPDGIEFGHWTRTTSEPTPLGKIFSESSLNHIGYRLPRESAPYCLNISNLTELQECYDSYYWDDSDFQVHPNVVHDMIAKFAPRSGKFEAVDCEELLKSAGDRVYVLYNVICAEQISGDSHVAPSVHHFYWRNDVNLTN